MDFVKHPNHTRYMNKPWDWDEKERGVCGSLSVHETLDAGSGCNVMESAWEPSLEEAVAMSVGLLQIRLGVFGRSHPVVYMGTGMPSTGSIDREELRKRVWRAAKWLEGIASGNGLEMDVHSGESGPVVSVDYKGA